MVPFVEETNQLLGGNFLIMDPFHYGKDSDSSCQNLKKY